MIRIIWNITKRIKWSKKILDHQKYYLVKNQKYSKEHWKYTNKDGSSGKTITPQPYSSIVRERAIRVFIGPELTEYTQLFHPIIQFWYHRWRQEKKIRDTLKIIDERVETQTSKINCIEKENLSHTQNQQNDSYVVIKLYMYNEYKFWPFSVY